jgi:ATP-binding protein involved in chromosome partitioning
MTKEKVLAALSTVQEPDLKNDLVTLTMIKNLNIDNNYISFDIELTTPACPLKDKMKNDCIKAIKSMVNEDAVIKIGFSSNTSTTRFNPNDVLKGVKNIISVVSGKGGVGIWRWRLHNQVQRWV